MPSFAASFDPFQLTLSDGVSEICLEDILFGEVWVTAGQSNMQMPLSAVQGSEQLPALANLFYVRVLSQSANGLPDEQADYPYQPRDDLSLAAWQRGDQPDQMSDVTAVGFSFAREVHLELHVPVGLIETALGGTCIHSWLSRDSVEQHNSLKNHIREIGFYRDSKDWNQTGDWSWNLNQPTALFNCKVAPLQGLGARGILWYQGESDYQYPEYYQKALQSLVRDWHAVFRPADSRGLGFLYVQLAPYYYGHRRFEQLAEFNGMLAAVRHILPCPAALVAIHDLPLTYDSAPEGWRHPIHPAVKLPIGQRLKTVAMGLLYQRKAPDSSPECSGIEIVGGKMLLSFTNIGEGLRLTGEDGLLRGFAICGPDRIFVEAQARILYGLRVLVWHEQISDPCAVTYAYADMNQTANLISRDQLPVVPFRSDREPSLYYPPLDWTHCESLQIWCCPQSGQPESTGWRPSWRVERGLGDLIVEKANKAEGGGSLFFRYQSAGSHEFGLEPILDYASQFPPLDLSIYSQLSIDIFNSDQQIKHLRLALASGPADAELQILPTRITVLPVLRWQRLQFDLGGLPAESLAAVRRLVFILDDRKGKGTLYLDQIRLIRP
ncbi:MAG TPA: hypothetical protein DD640_04075 [Clostridiales bacterium]|nr:hypothetical protein [Clostridiales bacterium]